ncbi:hypothetical protein ABZX40_20890 [Streptomyces sp. NPDC004610]|uniref:hypothetical protein n=1 Tax=unclassified Streptomyces TaxID=2593676 RepID=UPI00339E872A
MSSLHLMLGLLLVLVTGLLVVAVGYAVHRHPALNASVMAGACVLGVLVAVIGVILGVGAQ